MDTCLVCKGKDEAIEDLISEIARLKNRNRILSAVKSHLRRKLDELMKDADVKFEALCDLKPAEFLAD